MGVKWKVMRWLPSRRNVSGVTIDWRMPDFPFSPRSSLMLQRSATKRTTPSDMWVLRLSQTTFHGAVGGARRTDCPGTTQNLPRSEYLRWSRGLCPRRHQTRRSGLLCHAGYTRTPAVRRVQTSSAGSAQHVPAPEYRSFRRSRRSARPARQRRVPPDTARRYRRTWCRSRDQAWTSASSGCDAA